MSIYPSLEDMKFDQIARAQDQVFSQTATAPPLYGAPTGQPAVATGDAMYPSLNEYMGLELSEAVIAANMPEYGQVIMYQREVAIPQSNSNVVAPLSGQSLGLQRAQVSHGIREWQIYYP